MQKVLSSKDLLLGVMYAAFGVVWGINAIAKLPIGSAQRMGPGYFPLILCGLLIALGVILVFRSLKSENLVDFEHLPWRGLLFISASTLAFAALARGAGILPAIIVTSMIASFATRSHTWLASVLTAVVLAAFGVIVFIYGLGLPLSVFGRWFGA